MAKNSSSFHMGDEFNGSGKKTYLRATQHNKYKPLSQENIRLTPDYTQCLPKAVGAIPLIMNPSQTGVTSMMKALGGISSVTQVIISKDKCTGKYQTSFVVRKIQLTTGSYLHKSQGKDVKNKPIEQFIKETVSSFIN